MKSKGDQRAAFFLRMLKKPSEIITVMLIGNNMVLQLATLATTSLLLHLSMDEWGIPVEVLTTLLLFIPFFIFGEVLPKATYRLYAIHILLFSEKAVKLFRFLFWPFAYMMKFVDKLLSRWSQEEHEFDDTFDRKNLYRQMGMAFNGGVLSEEQLNTMTQAVSIGQRKVEQSMQQLYRQPMVSVDDHLKTVIELYRSTKKRAFPVYHQNRTNVIGLIDIKSLLFARCRGTLDENWPVRSVMEPMMTVPKGTPFSNVLPLFFKEKVSILAITKGGYGDDQEKAIGFLTWEEAMIKWLR